jgi:hypothetical protein
VIAFVRIVVACGAESEKVVLHVFTAATSELLVRSDGTFKAIATLFAEEGIGNLAQAPETNELLGMERILEHWTNLDQREPTLKIVCPKRLQSIEKPEYGIVNGGCPNLLWELRRARRRELTATQLANRNPTEKIVDKDNHLRDCLKYLVLTQPSPAQKTWRQKAAEENRPLAEARDFTSALIRWEQRKAEAEFRSQPVIIPIGRYAADKYRRMGLWQPR